MPNKDFKEHLIEDKAQLDEKIKRLSNFTEALKAGYSKIDIHQQKLLNTQLHIMEEYSQVLQERINL